MRDTKVNISDIWWRHVIHRKRTVLERTCFGGRYSFKMRLTIISGKLLSLSDSRCYLKTETKVSTRQGFLENYPRYHSTSHRHLLMPLDYGL